MTVSNSIKAIARKEVMGLPAYAAGLTIERAQIKLADESVVNLSVNENPLGVSDTVLSAIENALQRSAWYPDSHCHSLREKISQRLNVEADRIVIGNGSEDILSLICKTFISPGAEVLLAKPTFSLYATYTRMMSGKIIEVAMDHTMTYSIERWIETIKQHPHLRILMLANPSNPVGCAFNDSDCARLIEACPDDTLLVFDEAYYEFAENNELFANSLKLLQAQQRPWIVLRTFSKAYGLAGLRVGYAMLSDASIAELFDRVRTPYNVNRLAQVAAMAVMDDADYLKTTQALITGQREIMREQLQAMNLSVAPSCSNFLFIDVRQPSTGVAQALMQCGILVKAWTEPGYDSFIRVTVGTAEQNQRFLNALKTCLV